MEINRTKVFQGKPLINVLKEQRSYEKEKGFLTDSLDLFVKDVDNNKELGSVLVKNIAGNGSAAWAFETIDGDILKLSVGSHFPQGRPHEEFDVPIKKQGRAGKTYYYLEEKLYQHDMPEYFTDLVIEKIKKKGYEVFDLSHCDIHQIGMSQKGELYLLDPECARFKTIFHALFHKFKKLIKHI
jgi:hypothetical protein